MLLKKVKELGYPLFETETSFDANETLAEVVKSKEARLWEGFPLLLANSLEKELFDYKDVQSYLKSTSDKNQFQALAGMSLALYRYLGLKFLYPSELSDYLDKESFNEFLNAFKKKQTLGNLSKKLSSDRVVNTFKNYFKSSETDLKEYTKMKEEFNLEYALSQVFSEKQKELFMKKLKGEKMTKTEREYFSRSVRKKLLALANSDLHKLAISLLNE